MRFHYLGIVTLHRCRKFAQVPGDTLEIWTAALGGVIERRTE